MHQNAYLYLTTFGSVGEVVPSNTPLLFNYTVGSTQILLYPNDNVKESIKWTPEEVQDGDTKQYNLEFPNPVEFSTVFSAIGTGVHTMTAYYRMSPVTLIGSVELAIKGTLGQYQVYLEIMKLLFVMMEVNEAYQDI